MTTASLARQVAAGATALLLAACGSDSGTGPAGDRFARRDLPALFAPPTPAEKEQVLADWAARDVSPRGVRLERTDTVAVGIDTVEVRILSHLVAGARHYGALTVPLAAADPVPVLVYTHFSASGVGVESALFALGAVAGVRVSQFALVIPSFRGMSVSLGRKSWQSEGDISPWDGEVDDALALLHVAWETAPVVAGGAAALGFSGGGAVALLMAVREPEIAQVVDFFAPTDFFGPFARDLFTRIFDGDPPNLLRVPQLETRIVGPLRRGELSLEEMRLELLRRSAARFAERLPAVLAHHGTADEVVPQDETRRLVEALRAAGGEVEVYYYPGGGHSPFELAGSLGRTAAFLGQLSPVARPAPGSPSRARAAPPSPSPRRTQLASTGAGASRSSWFSAAGATASRPAKGWPPPMQ